MERRTRIPGTTIPPISGAGPAYSLTAFVAPPPRCGGRKGPGRIGSKLNES